MIYAVRTAGEGATADVTTDEIEEGVQFENIPSFATQVYVVGNYNSSDQDGDAADFPTTIGQTLSSVRNTVLNIQQVAHGTLSDGNTSTELLTIMEGQATIEDYGDNPADWNGDNNLTSEDLYANVTLAPINARLEINQISYTGIAESFTLEGIYINYFYSQLPLSLNRTGYSYTNNGSDTLRYDRENAAFGYTYYTTLYDRLDSDQTPAGSATISPVNGTWAYHVFGNSQPVPHIILKLTDITLPDDNNVGTRFVTVKGFMSGTTEITTFQRNTIYRITNLEFTDDDLDLLPETENIEVWVHVEVAPWTTVDVTPII